MGVEIHDIYGPVLPQTQLGNIEPWPFSTPQRKQNGWGNGGPG